ncbi:MAG: membrane protein insertion efficiency factor YidD [Actinomycetota bacterium]
MNGTRRVLWRAGAPARAVLLAAIFVYRRTLSGMLGGQCRFVPTCSHYGAEAIRVHGAVRGGGMTLWRIARCGPFTRGGIDRVPPRGSRPPTYDGVNTGRSYDAVAQRDETGAHA